MADSAKKVLFLSIESALQALIPADFKTVDRWNSQYEAHKSEENKQDAFNYPAAMIEIVTSEPYSEASGSGKVTQKAETDVTIHIGIKVVNNIHTEDLDLHQKIYETLQGLQDDCFTDLVRTEDDQDYDYTSIYWGRVTFTTLITDQHDQPNTKIGVVETIGIDVKCN